ncbi:MAG: hypothetical protein QXS74_09010 [Nitrososphaeria archaeon]
MLDLFFAFKILIILSAPSIPIIIFMHFTGIFRQSSILSALCSSIALSICILPTIVLVANRFGFQITRDLVFLTYIIYFLTGLLICLIPQEIRKNLHKKFNVFFKNGECKFSADAFYRDLIIFAFLAFIMIIMLHVFSKGHIDRTADISYHLAFCERIDRLGYIPQMSILDPEHLDIYYLTPNFHLLVVILSKLTSVPLPYIYLYLQSTMLIFAFCFLISFLQHFTSKYLPAFSMALLISYPIYYEIIHSSHHIFLFYPQELKNSLLVFIISSTLSLLSNLRDNKVSKCNMLGVFLQAFIIFGFIHFHHESNVRHLPILLCTILAFLFTMRKSSFLNLLIPLTIIIIPLSATFVEVITSGEWNIFRRYETLSTREIQPLRMPIQNVMLVNALSVFSLILSYNYFLRARKRMFFIPILLWILINTVWMMQDFLHLSQALYFPYRAAQELLIPLNITISSSMDYFLQKVKGNGCKIQKPNDKHIVNKRRIASLFLIAMLLLSSLGVLLYYAEIIIENELYAPMEWFNTLSWMLNNVRGRKAIADPITLYSYIAGGIDPAFAIDRNKLAVFPDKNLEYIVYKAEREMTYKFLLNNNISIILISKFTLVRFPKEWDLERFQNESKYSLIYWSPKDVDVKIYRVTE